MEEAEQSGSAYRSVRRLGPYARPWRRYLILAMIATICAMAAGLTIPLMIQSILDGPIARGETTGLLWPVAGVALFGLAEAGFFYCRRKLLARPTTHIEARMRRDLYAHLQRLPVAFHDRWQSGQLLSRAVADLSTIRGFFAFVGIFLVVNSLTLIGGLVVLFTLDFWLGLTVLVSALPLIAISTVFERRYKVVARLAQDQDGDLATTVEESALGIRVLKAFGRGPHLAHRFLAQAKLLRGTELRKVRIQSLLWGAIVLLPEIGIAGQLLVGTSGIVDGTMTVGTLVAAVTVAAYLRWPTDSIGWLLAETNQTAAAADRYFEALDAPVTVADPPDPKAPVAPAAGLLRFENVHFRHAEGGAEILRGVDLEVRPGETVALVGATGSGKTTLTALVPRLADVTDGRITVDGVNIAEMRLADLRTLVSMAFEEPVLFSASVRENIALGSTDATDDQIWEALRIAQADKFVELLPWSLDTRIGEQGLSLSGGQRQRLALARAIVGKPEILVLDDPLSALDVHTEAEVERALREVLSGVTALVVAHRPSTVQLADRVAMLADGRIAAVGTHSELLAGNQAYRKLLSTSEEETEGVRA
ncbi:ABC transporter ATP-binding protein [Kibdelosporangium phytohabitans]|uniref:ABC transporter n=1 Tax=Kibdelosporangium phytohabitans TaxID=860235 RepID=A0A0N9HSC6_9PSEU|nr:ABC transporter ATP-binding protein [Kibdelosporangium phytohabitans]ALG06052.1 ABC transporter [Kibdelosporangium phytohabitans]MBE1465869.1 ATP-binding cassette subfamily B protein [Kibdelosporangium phytohabitans]